MKGAIKSLQWASFSLSVIPVHTFCAKPDQSDAFLTRTPKSRLRQSESAHIRAICADAESLSHDTTVLCGHTTDDVEEIHDVQIKIGLRRCHYKYV